MLNKSPLISVNGIPDAHISPLDRGFAYGDGVFETCRMMDGQVPLWSRHLARLVGSCERLFIPIDTLALESHRSRLIDQSIAEGVYNGILKVIVTRGEGGRGYALPAQVYPTICVIIYPHNQVDDCSLTGVSLRVCQQRLSSCPDLAGMKHLNRLEQILARAEWRDTRYAEGVLLDENDHVIEATASNIFMVCDKIVYTPNLARCGVAGIMRALVMEELAPALGLPVRMTEIPLTELLAADEVFLCNSVRGITSVKDITSDQQVVLPEVTVTQRLQAQLNFFLQSQCRSLTADQ